MERERNYGAEMATYLETLMSAAVQPITPNIKSVQTLHLLADTVREGQGQGAFEALCQQLRPVLIRLADKVKPESPEDLTNVLYLVVKKGARTLPEIEAAIQQRYFSEIRSQIREQRKVQSLTLVHSQNSGTTKNPLTGQATPVVLPSGLPPGAVSFVFKDLSEEEQLLWIARSEKVPFAEIAEELGCTEGAARNRWFTLATKLRKLLSDFEK